MEVWFLCGVSPTRYRRFRYRPYALNLLYTSFNIEVILVNVRQSAPSECFFIRNGGTDFRDRTPEHDPGLQADPLTLFDITLLMISVLSNQGNQGNQGDQGNQKQSRNLRQFLRQFTPRNK